jgi:hypothetical protein
MDEPEVLTRLPYRCDDHFPISNELRDDGTDGIVAPVAGALCLRDRKRHEFRLRFVAWRNHCPTVPLFSPRRRSRQPGRTDANSFAPMAAYSAPIETDSTSALGDVSSEAPCNLRQFKVTRLRASAVFQIPANHNSNGTTCAPGLYLLC